MDNMKGKQSRVTIPNIVPVPLATGSNRFSIQLVPVDSKPVQPDLWYQHGRWLARLVYDNTVASFFRGLRDEIAVCDNEDDGCCREDD